uniref:Ctr_Y_1 conopeptide n=2 Tax=Splinoconus TaxID=2056757 RepID=A0A0K8TTV0_CONTD
MLKMPVLLLAILLLLPLATAQDDKGSQAHATQRRDNPPCAGGQQPCDEPAGQSCCGTLKCVSNRCCPTTDGC